MNFGDHMPVSVKCGVVAPLALAPRLLSRREENDLEPTSNH